MEKFDKVPPKLVAAFAALICFYSGKRGGEDIPLKDSEAALTFFKEVWDIWMTNKDTKQLVQAVLANESFWEQDLNQVNGLSNALVLEVGKQVS